jgi:hypothetical protein
MNDGGDFLGALCVYYARIGDFRRAAQGLGAYDFIYQQYRHLLYPRDQLEYDEAVQTARLALGEEAFRAAWETGQSMGFRQAFDTFLAEL